MHWETALGDQCACTCLHPTPAVSPHMCTSKWTVIRTHVDTQLAPCMCTDGRSVTHAHGGEGGQARVDALRKTVAHQEQLLRTLKGQLALKEAHQKSLLLAQAQQQLDERRGGQQQKAASLASGPAERSRNGAAASRHKAALRRTGADSAAVAEPAKASCHVASASASNLSPPTSENAAPAHDAQPLMPWTVDLSQVRARGAGPDTRMRAGAMYFLCQWRCASWTGDELHVHLFWAHAD